MTSILIVSPLAMAGAALVVDLPPLPESEAWMDQPGHVWAVPMATG